MAFCVTVEDFVGLIARAFHFNRWCLSIHSTIDIHTHKVRAGQNGIWRERREEKNAKEKCNQLKRFSSSYQQHSSQVSLSISQPFLIAFCYPSNPPRKKNFSSSYSSFFSFASNISALKNKEKNERRENTTH